MSALIIVALIIIPISIAVASIILLWKRKASGAPAIQINYRFFFIMGLVLMPIGLSLMVVALFTELYIAAPGLPFFSLGLVYLAIGLANRDKWNKQ